MERGDERNIPKESSKLHRGATVGRIKSDTEVWDNEESSPPHSKKCIANVDIYMYICKHIHMCICIRVNIFTCM